MADRLLSTKFGLDPCSGFWETWVNRRTTDACAMTVALLTKLSRAKIDRNRRGGGVLARSARIRCWRHLQDLETPSTESVWLESVTHLQAQWFIDTCSLQDTLLIIFQTLNATINTWYHDGELQWSIASRLYRCLTWEGNHSDSELKSSLFDLLKD